VRQEHETNMQLAIPIADTEYTTYSTYRAVSVRQARVALDHFFSDVQLVTDTINEFEPEKVKLRQEQAAQTAVEQQESQVEVGQK
jgi:hypothetical protein